MQGLNKGIIADISTQTFSELNWEFFVAVFINFEVCI